MKIGLLLKALFSPYIRLFKSFIHWHKYYHVETFSDLYRMDGSLFKENQKLTYYQRECQICGRCQHKCTMSFRFEESHWQNGDVRVKP